MIYLLSFTVFTLALAGLSLGVLAGRAGIRGTCGGLNNPDASGCGICGRAANEECPRKQTA